MGAKASKKLSDDSPIGKLNLARTFYNYGDISTDCRIITGNGDGSFQPTCDPGEVMTGIDPNMGLAEMTPFPVLQDASTVSVKCCKLVNPLDTQQRTASGSLTNYTGGLPQAVLNPNDGSHLPLNQWGIGVRQTDPPQLCPNNQMVSSTCVTNGYGNGCLDNNTSNLWCGGMNDQQTVDFPAPAIPAPANFTFYKSGEFALTDCKNIPAASLRTGNPGVGDHQMTSCPDGYLLSGYSFDQWQPYITCCKPAIHPTYQKYLDEIKQTPERCCFFGAIGAVDEQFPAGSAERNVCDYLGLSVDIGKSKYSTDCYRAMNNYCADNLDDPACQTYCNLPDENVNCDAMLSNYCSNHPDASNDICGCFRPDAFANYQSDLKKDFPAAAGLIAGFNDVNCYYPPCEASTAIHPYAVKQGIHPGCTALVCINNVNVDNQGNIQGGVTVNQSNDCQMWQTKDCEISWGNWSDCDASGNQTRTGTISQQAQNGGQECPPTDGLTQTRKCDSQDCQVQCSGWSDCSVPCGGGTQSRECTITKQPVSGGAACPPLHQVQACNTDACKNPVDCQVEWGDWGPCVDGRQSRTATVTVQPVGMGKACPSLTQTQACSGGDSSDDLKKKAIIAGAVIGGVLGLLLIGGLIAWVFRKDSNNTESKGKK